MFEEQCKKGVVTTNVKFEEFAEQWLSEYASVNLKKSTYQRMKATTSRIYPALGHLRLDKITHGQIQAFIDDLSRNGKNVLNGNSLSRKIVVHHLNFLSDVFSYASRLGVIDSNPCINVIVPKGAKKEKNFYTVEEIKKLFTLIEENDVPLKYKAFVTLAVYSGFRRGELMGLEWKDVDWENNVISVKRTSNYTSSTGRYTDTTKTKGSMRSLKLPDKVFKVLKELYNEEQELKKELGNKWVDSDRLFISWDGSPMFCGTPYYWLKKFTEKHNMRFCDIHSFRHFNATTLIHAGIDAATVSAALGHSNVSTTTGIYLHAFQEVQARTSTAIAEALDFSDGKENNKLQEAI